MECLPSSDWCIEFKGAISELTSRVFVIGPNQVNKHDDTYKYVLHYFGNKFNHRVYRESEFKDRMVGLALPTKPTASTIKKVVQEVTPGDNSKFVGIKRIVIDKDSEDYLEYQVELK